MVCLFSQSSPNLPVANIPEQVFILGVNFPERNLLKVSLPPPQHTSDPSALQPNFAIN